MKLLLGSTMMLDALKLLLSAVCRGAAPLAGSGAPGSRNVDAPLRHLWASWPCLPSRPHGTDRVSSLLTSLLHLVRRGICICQKLQTGSTPGPSVRRVHGQVDTGFPFSSAFLSSFFFFESREPGGCPLAENGISLRSVFAVVSMMTAALSPDAACHPAITMNSTGVHMSSSRPEQRMNAS